MNHSKLLRSSAFRYSLLYMVLFGGSVFVLMAFIYWSTSGYMDSQARATIEAESRGLLEQYRVSGVGGLILRIRNRVENADDRYTMYLLTDSRFNPLAGNVDRWPARNGAPEPSDTQDAGKDDSWLTFTFMSRDDEDPLLVLARHIMLEGGEGGYHLLVGRDITERTQIEKMLLESWGYGMGITIILGLAGGLLMSRGMLRRIDAINRTTREIMRGDFSKRVDASGSSDELDRLAVNLNAMLDRIEDLMAGIRQVSDNIAHDLRSPLSRLRSGLEMALLGARDMDECREAMAEALDKTDNLLGTFNALLKIAQAEAGAFREQADDLDLSLIAEDMADLYQPLAEEQGLTLTTAIIPRVRVMGNKHLLSQALANLLDNAIKYSESGGVVNLSLKATPMGVALVVADQGPGIPEESRDKVLERFHRLEESRNAPGSGLGLSLVSAVAKLHRAELILGDNDPGLTITLLFPATMH